MGKVKAFVHMDANADAGGQQWFLGHSSQRA